MSDVRYRRLVFQTKSTFCLVRHSNPNVCHIGASIITIGIFRFPNTKTLSLSTCVCGISPKEMITHDYTCPIAIKVSILTIQSVLFHNIYKANSTLRVQKTSVAASSNFFFQIFFFQLSFSLIRLRIETMYRKQTLYLLAWFVF